MKLRSLGERELIALIAKEFPKKGRDLILGIGDDAALIKPGKIPIILTKDLLVEKVDFFRSLHPPYFLGRKSLNVSLSDIAAMGGRPRFALLGLGLPPATRASWIGEWLGGPDADKPHWGIRSLTSGTRPGGLRESCPDRARGPSGRVRLCRSRPRRPDRPPDACAASKLLNSGQATQRLCVVRERSKPEATATGGG